MRKTYAQLNESKRIVLKESWNTNGSLEDFDPKKLIDKAFENKYATNSVREYGDKILYINVDPGFLFGARMGEEVWIDVVEIDSDNNQERIYMEKLPDEEAEKALTDWKDEYIAENRE